MTPERGAERCGLGVAQGGELGGGIRHRAVVLAQLGRLPAPVHARGVASVRQRLGDRRHRVVRLSRQVRDELGGALLGEGRDACVALRGVHEAQRLQGERVVRRAELGPPGRRDAVDERWSPATSGGRRPEGGSIARDDEARLGKARQDAADPRWGDAEPVRQLGSRRRPLLEEAARDTLRTHTGDFHNTIVA